MLLVILSQQTICSFCSSVFHSNYFHKFNLQANFDKSSVSFSLYINEKYSSIVLPLPIMTEMFTL